MKPYYYIFKDPTYSSTHVTYKSYQKVTDFQPLGYKIGNGSATHNAVMNQLLEIDNIKTKQAKPNLSLDIPELPEPNLTFQLPEDAFIKQLIRKDIRVKHGCIGFMRTRTAFNKLWNLNLSRVVEIYYSKYGYYITRESILYAMKQYATVEDKLSHAISQKIAPEIKPLKNDYSIEDVLVINTSDEQIPSYADSEHFGL